MSISTRAACAANGDASAKEVNVMAVSFFQCVMIVPVEKETVTLCATCARLGDRALAQIPVGDRPNATGNTLLRVRAQAWAPAWIQRRHRAPGVAGSPCESRRIACGSRRQ